MDALREAGCTVHAHAEYFAANCPDTVWLREVGRRGWIVLTKDARIRYRPNERRILLNSRVKAFIPTGKGGTGADIAQTFVKALPSIRRITGNTKPPFIAHDRKGGHVEVMEPKPR